MTIESAVLFAASGALGLKLLELAELRNIPKIQRPDLTDWIYWLPFLVMPLVGGGLALVYIMSDIILKPILAVNIGISAPLILRAMAEANPLQSKGIDPGVGA